MRKKSHNLVRALVVLAMVVTIVGVIAAPAAAQVAGIAPTAGPVGTSVTVTATGYAPNSILTATFSSAAVTTAPVVVETDATGAATFALLIPAATAGAHTIKVSDGVNSVSNTFTVQPKVKISPTKGPVGTTATVTGSGFAAGVTADVTVNGVSFKRMVAIDSDGSFTAESTIPVVPSGDRDVTAADGAGNSAIGPIVDPGPPIVYEWDNSASFTVTPTLALSPSSGLAGSKVDITGSGWAEDAVVSFMFGGGTWVDVTASGLGVLDATGIATLASATPGVKSVSGFDGTNTATVNFTVEPRILNLTPQSGPMGTKVLITGGSMTPDGTIPAGWMQIGGTPWNTASEITIDTGGVMAPTTLTVPPALVVGENIVGGQDTGGLQIGNIFIVTKPTVGVSPASGPKGSAVTVQGAGWVPNSTVTLNFAQALMTVIADSNGNIAAAMSVPATAVTGSNALTASDGLGNAADDAAFTVPSASITVSPNEGGPGDAVTISGTGFAGYAAITVKFGGYELPTTPLSSPLGDFSIATTVPGVAPGSQVVQAMDSSSTATTFFVVKAAAVTIANQLAGIVDTVVIVWDYNGGDWQFFDPADTAGSNLATLVAGTGYWINASADVELIFGGTAYQLTEGWNNVGWRG